MKCTAVLHGSTSTPHESGNKTKKKEKKLHTNGRAKKMVTTGIIIRIQPVKKPNNVIVIQITVSNIRLRYLGIPISVFNILITVINHD